MLNTIALRLLSRGLQRSLASGVASEFAALSAQSSAACSSAAVCQTDSTNSVEPTKDKLQQLKSKDGGPTPVSQAVAFMISKDQMPREQLRSNMDSISEQLLRDVTEYSSTELSAFTEACRQIEYTNAAVFSAIINHLATTASSIAVDELPSLLWAGAQLTLDSCDDTNTSTNTSRSRDSRSPTPSSNNSSSDSSSDSTTTFSSNSSTTTDSTRGGVGRTVAVPRNDGVCGSVNSEKIAGQPGLVQFLLGASQVLTGDLDELSTEELPVLASALADMEYRDPFLLTALAEAAIDRKLELSQSELLSLISTFADMGRWFFDNRLLDQLTAEVVVRARDGRVDRKMVDHVVTALEGINHKNKVLQQYLLDRL